MSSGHREDIKNILVKLEQINESPYLHDRELFYFEVAAISPEALSQRYTHLGTVLSEIEIYEKNNQASIVVGILSETGDLYHFLDMQEEKKNYPIPTQIESNYKQFGMVMISEKIAGQGITKSVFEFLAHLFDIVSDKVQFLGAKRLWKSLARSSAVNVYVYDGNKADYRRDESGMIIKYNGSNLDDLAIWGKTSEHENVLLVATTKVFH